MLKSEVTSSAIAPSPSALDPRPTSVVLASNDHLTAPLSFHSRSASAVAFIDAALPDSQTLAAGLQPGTAVYLLNPNGDELSQISQVLAHYSNLDSVQIFSHGSDGALQLGNTSLNPDNLIDYAEILQSWAGSFSEDGDLLLMGCNLAADATGQSFVNQIASLTGADVAASTDLTGSSALGGDWDLEFATGSIEASDFLTPWAQAAYQYVLATYTVDTLSDVVDANDGVLSLREAIAAANASAGVADTINFAAGLTGTITLTNGQLVLTDRADTRISGGNAITVSGNNATRVFQINSGAIATLEGLTISGGSASDGGGINNDGYLTVMNSTLSGNTAGNWGGGINSNGYLTVINSTLSGNGAGRFGGGINSTGTLTVTDSTLSGNRVARGDGGGINSTGTLTVSNSTLSGNRAVGGSLPSDPFGSGGGINNTGTATVSTSLLSGNRGDTFGGGIANTGTLTVSNSTLSANITNNRTIPVQFSNGKGGNIFNGPTSTLTVSNSTLHNGRSGSGGNVFNEGNLTMNSITSADGYADFMFETPALISNFGTLSASNSLFLDGVLAYAVSINGDRIGAVPGDSNWVDTNDLGLDITYSYGDNGGPTPTVTFPSDSTIATNTIDQGNTTLTTDQRGVARTQGAAADIGAVEFLPPGQRAVVFSNLRTFLPENFTAATPLKVADITILGDSTGPNVLSLSGADANVFELVGNQLFLKANTPLDFETQPSLSVTVGVDGPDEDSSPDATGVFTLNVANLAESSTFTVTNTNDSGAGSLRQAILNANASPGQDIITFNSSLIGQTIALSSGELTITQGVSIDGDLDDDGTPDITVNANQRSRVFNVDDRTGAQQLVTLEGLMITGGSGIDEGGGIGVRENLTVRNSTISGNSAGQGGGFYVFNASLTVDNSTLSGNFGGEGGGIYLFSSNLTVRNSTIDNNTARLGGGGIYRAFANNQSGVTVHNSTISNNKVTETNFRGEGGGISMEGGSLTVSNSTLSGNTASTYGGGIAFLAGASVTVRNSTITKNTALFDLFDAGGGIAAYDGSITAVSSIIAGNTNGDLDIVPNRFASFSSGGYNLIGTGNAIGAFNQTGDITNVTDPGLGALANNGGPTQTHALLAGSLAIDAGSNPDGLTTDQRGTGFDRVVNGRIDIGAFEYVPPANQPPVATNDSFTTNEDTPLTGNVITNPNPDGVDSDPDGNPISVATVNGLAANVGQTITLASGSTLTVQTDGSFTYTPASTYNGSDSFTYTLSDGSATSSTATVSLTVTPVNDPPTATNLSAAETYTEDTPLNLTDIVITDIDSPTVTATLTLSNPAAGSLTTATSGAVTSTYNAGTGLWSASGAIADVNALLAGVTFTPAANFNGNFAIATSVTDGASPAITGTKTFTGTAVNDAPVAVNDTVSTTDTQAVTFNVLSNDSDVDAGDVLAIVSNTSPASGSLVRNADNTFTYTPVIGFVGNTSFNYTIRDLAGATSTATVTITVAAGSNSILGTTGNDTLVGSSQPDTIEGLAGNDTLNGGAGADSLIGGSGNDTYIVDALDTIVEAADEGIDLVRANITYSLANIANVENLTLTGNANINGTGNALDNVITGNSGSNILTGGAGNDTYVVGAGDTVVENAGEGTDLVQSSVTFSLASCQNVENLTLTGSAAINGTGNTLDNVITGNSANNTLNGDEGNDTLNGGGGNDTLNGGGGNDTLNGGAGGDTMRGGTGDDIYVVNSDGDRVIEALNEGIDLVQSSVSFSLGGNVENLTLTGSGALEGTGNGLDNVITGNSGRNTLSGGAGNDILNGGGGADTLLGGTGNDTLNGGAGNDTLTGGAGNDTFVYNSFSDRNDTITDFSTSLDNLDLRALLTSLGYQGSNPIADGFLRFTQSGSNTLVQVDQNGATGGASFSTLVTLNNVTASTLVIGTNVLIS